jgi:hypothetical protein
MTDGKAYTRDMYKTDKKETHSASPSVASSFEQPSCRIIDGVPLAKSTQKMADLPALLRFYNRKHDPFTRTRFGADLQGDKKETHSASPSVASSFEQPSCRIIDGVPLAKAVFLHPNEIRS